jgi:hypothetical protein
MYRHGWEENIKIDLKGIRYYEYSNDHPGSETAGNFLTSYVILTCHDLASWR